MKVYLIHLRDDPNKTDPRYKEGHFGRWTDCHNAVREEIETGDYIVFLQGHEDKVKMPFATRVYVDGGGGLNWDPKYQPYELDESPNLTLSFAKRIRPEISDSVDKKRKKKSTRQIIGEHFRSYNQPFEGNKAKLILQKFREKGNPVGKQRVGKAFPGTSSKTC